MHGFNYSYFTLIIDITNLNISIQLISSFREFTIVNILVNIDRHSEKKISLKMFVGNHHLVSLIILNEFD